MTPTTKGFHLFEDADYQKKYTSITIKDNYNILEYYGSLNENKHDNFFVLNDTYVFKCPNAKIRRYWISQIIKTPINPTDHNNFRLVTDTNTTINNTNSTNNQSRFNDKNMYTCGDTDEIKYTFIQQSESDQAEYCQKKQQEVEKFAKDKYEVTIEHDIDCDHDEKNVQQIEPVVTVANITPYMDSSWCYNNNNNKHNNKKKNSNDNDSSQKNQLCCRLCKDNLSQQEVSFVQYS